MIGSRVEQFSAAPRSARLLSQPVSTTSLPRGGLRTSSTSWPTISATRTSRATAGRICIRRTSFGPLKSGYDHFYGFRGGGVDYFSHATGNRGDLWDDDVEIHQMGYLTDLLG